MNHATSLTEQSVAARLERLPYSRWHISITIILGVAIFFDSFDSLAIAYVLPAISRAWTIPPEKIGPLISIANFGQALGALFFGWLAERIGRVRAAQLTIAIYAVMSFACAFTNSYEQLFWCRFVEGIGLGGEIPVASTYISEILRAERRGGSFLSYQMIFPIGLLGAGVAGAEQSDGKDHLIGQERAAATFGAQDLADIGRGHRDLAAEADALDEAAPEELLVAVGEGAGEAHHGIDRDGELRRPHAADALGEPAEEERAERLAEIGDTDERADFLRRNGPGARDRRQDIGDRQRVERIEENGDAEDDGDRDMPARIGQPLEARSDGLLRQ